MAPARLQWARPNARTGSTSWLCRGIAERRRMLDMIRRLRAVGRIIAVVLVIFTALAIPGYGPALFASALIASLVYSLLESRMPLQRRPEYLMVLAFAAAELLLAGGIALSTGPTILLLALLVVPTLLFSAAMPRRGAVVATIASGALIVLTGLIVDSSGVVHAPPLVIYPLAVLLSLSVVASVAQAADVASRATAFIDPLTGILNRTALFSRTTELTHQAMLTGEPVAVVIADVDHFKQINDRHGHGTGDAVLAGIATRLRAQLRAEDSIFRFGGEEFVVLAPGADLTAGTAIARAIRDGVRSAPIDELSITVSVGVCASSRGDHFDFQAVFEAADNALYAAKDQGRDRVGVAEHPVDAEAQSGGERGAVRFSPAAEAPLQGRSERHARRLRVTGTAEASLDGHGDRVSSDFSNDGNWLMPDASARAHMLDLQKRLHRIRILAYGAVFAAVVIGGPWYGFSPILPPLVGTVVLGIVVLRVDHFHRPEFVLGGTVLLWFVLNASAFLLTHGSPLCALPMLVIPAFAWSPAFPARGVAIGTALSAALIVLAAVLVAGHQALSSPIPIGVPLVVLAAAAVVASALGRSAVDHRSAAVIDQLTGLLIRQALDSRIAELAHRVDQTGEAVTAMIGDIDNFKQINDRAGHHTGDLVLREVGYRIRKNLRAFESVYRIGGDEFVILLAGAHALDAADIAERVRTTISGEAIEGLSVTLSVGAASTDEGQPFEFASLFERADHALYEAKRTGRNRVSVCGGDAQPAAAPVSAAA